ncbi:NAD+--asparagine ADP-ribosyltransferase [Bacillus sp. RC251]|uniref:HNH endonuclease n=1 Tax=Bacillus TaxID=1386 RepID=UPI0011452089|nr:HNH endonuclease [Bacillus wiedmannii]
MYCVGFIPFNFVLASVKVPVYRTNDNGTLERVGTNVEGWVHGHCIDSNQKIQDEIDSVRASLAEIRGSGGTKGTGNREAEVPPAFKQEEFASTYESRFKQTPAETNSNVVFEGVRGESLCTLKPPPDPTLQKILNEAGINGIEYKNGVPDFSPVAKAQFEIEYMLGGTGKHGTKARTINFKQADQKLAEQLNNSPELASKFGMTPGKIKAGDIADYREEYKLTWHELNDVKTIQLVPSEINGKFGHLGGVGEINAGAFKSGEFANK